MDGRIIIGNVGVIVEDMSDNIYWKLWVRRWLGKSIEEVFLQNCLRVVCLAGNRHFSIVIFNVIISLV